MLSTILITYFQTLHVNAHTILRDERTCCCVNLFLFFFFFYCRLFKTTTDVFFGECAKCASVSVSKHSWSSDCNISFVISLERLYVFLESDWTLAAISLLNPLSQDPLNAGLSMFTYFNGKKRFYHKSLNQFAEENTQFRSMQNKKKKKTNPSKCEITGDQWLNHSQPNYLSTHHSQTSFNRANRIITSA